MRQRRQTRRDTLQDVAPVDPLARMDISVLRDQHLRFDLPEAVQNRHMPHVGRTKRPYRTKRGGGQKGDKRLKRVGQNGNHPVALPHAHFTQCGLRRTDPRLKRIPCQHLPSEGFGLQDHRLIRTARRGMAQNLGCEIRLCPRKPVGARHLAFGQNLGPARDGQIEKPDDRRPEAFQIGDGPFPERVIIREFQSPLGLEPANELRQLRAFGPRGIGFPQDGARLGHGDPPLIVWRAGFHARAQGSSGGCHHLPCNIASISRCTRSASSSVAKRCGRPAIIASRSSSCARRLVLRGSRFVGVTRSNAPPSEVDTA